MKDGEEYLTFPGPGGYQIEWSPGTRRYKLERAPSGHLILPCDAFHEVKPTKGGLTTTTKEFFTDDVPKGDAVSSPSSSSQSTQQAQSRTVDPPQQRTAYKASVQAES